MRVKIAYTITVMFLASVIFAQQGDGGQWNTCRLDSIYQFTWDTISQNWAPQSKIVRTHNINRYLINSDIQPWNGSAYDTANQKDTFSYDANGNFVNDITKIWNGTSWLTYQAVYNYNASSQRTGMRYQRLNGSVWEDLQQNSFTYDGNGYLTSQVTQTWAASQWLNSVRYTYANNSNGKPNTLLIETWNSAQWVNYRQYSYSYDGSGYETGVSMKTWDGSQFSNEYEETFTNNNNGFHDAMLMTRWDGSNWINYRKVDYYHYCTNVSSIEPDLTGNRVSVYPNPFIDKLNLEPHISYQLFDLMGKELNQNALSGLPAGTYVLKTKYGSTRLIKADK